MNAEFTKATLADRLRASALTSSQIADAVEVDRATARNWMTGRITRLHPRNARAVERLLARHERRLN